MWQKIRNDKKWFLGLSLLALSSGSILFWKLQSVSRSEYYAAIAKSMSLSWSNFLFGAIDPAGTVTLDKIPGSYWMPALFARIFGFSTWSITAPNALAAVATVIVVSITAKNLFNRTAGILAGAIVATTPIVIAVSRSNQPQSFFLLTLALAGWQAGKALQHSSRKHLVIAGAFIALAFHTYMLQAWAVWPALIIAWFFTDGTLRKKILDLLIAGSTSFLLSLTWIFVVLLFPASSRPYIGGTYHNNPFEMVFGYNGLGRFSATQSSTLSSSSDNPIYRSFTPPFGGSAGFGRFFSSAVAGQITWLIPTAFVAAVILIVVKTKKSIVVFYGLWLIVFFTMFSVVAGIHQFYTSSLAIPTAVAVGGAVSLAAREAKHLHLYILLNVAGFSAIYFAALYSDYKSWAPYVQAALILFVVAILALHAKKFVQYSVPIAVLIGLVFTPSVWAIDSVNHTNSINPVAGSSDGMGGGGFMGGGVRGGNFNPGQMPPQRGNFSGGPAGGGNFGGFGQQENSSLISYLKQNRAGAKYLLVTFGAQTAASFITSTGENIMPVGGFDGEDPTPTLTVFKKLVASGQVRYILMGGMESRGNRNNGNEIQRWVGANCTIDEDAPSQQLYICTHS